MDKDIYGIISLFRSTRFLHLPKKHDIKQRKRSRIELVLAVSAATTDKPAQRNATFANASSCAFVLNDRDTKWFESVIGVPFQVAQSSRPASLSTSWDRSRHAASVFCGDWVIS